MLPQDMCFLLALQAVVMGLNARGAKRLRGHLDTTQRAMFKASYELLKPRQDYLRTELGIPTNERDWPKAPDLTDEAIQLQLRQFRRAPGDGESVVTRREVKQDRRRPTFCVRKTRMTAGFFVGAMCGCVLVALGVAGAAAIPVLGILILADGS